MENDRKNENLIYSETTLFHLSLNFPYKSIYFDQKS